MSERAFKGIWIPAEIWLHEGLTALDKIIWGEINSLDNDQGCRATNKYLANFCGCSEAAITKAVAKLTELEMITIEHFDGHNRVIRTSENLLPNLVKFTTQPRKIYEVTSENLRGSEAHSYYIENNKEIYSEKYRERKGDALEARLSAFSDSEEVRQAIRDFIAHRKTIKKPMNDLALNRMLKTLAKIGQTDEEKIAILDKSIERGWAGIFPLKEEDRPQQPAPRQAAPARQPAQKKNFFTDYDHNYSHGAPNWDEIQNRMEAEPKLKFAKT